MMSRMTAGRFRSLFKHAWSRYAIALLLAATLLAATPAISHAASSSDDDEEVVDGRLYGYEKKVDLGSSTALQWVLLMILGVVCIAPLFMSAKRTHLD